MSDLSAPLIDAWSPLSHKRPLGPPGAPGPNYTAPSWVGDHARRLMAYTILDSYTKNVARQFIAAEDQDEIDNHREYGDPDVIVQQALASLLGETQALAVHGASSYREDLPDDATEEQVAANNQALAAVERQEMLEQWATDEQLILKLHETERDAVKLGDGVYVMSWSNKKKRPRLRCYDPGFYFPVLPDVAEDEFPTRVHLAWELETEDNSDERLVRRITYELLPLQPLRNPDGSYVIDENGDAQWPDDVVIEQSRTDPSTGEIIYGGPRRQYPWNAELSAVSCYMTDAIFTIGPKARVDDFSEEKAVFQLNEDGRQIRQLDLGIDFLPVIHIPNTIAQKDHFGQSALANVLQILDDLASADTDLSAAGATSGAPAIGISGGTLPPSAMPIQNGPFANWSEARSQKFGPGATIAAPQGKVELLSTAGALDPLSNYVLHLLDRLSTNARIPASVLGRVKPSEVPSGLALALSFGPMKSFVGQMRLVRTGKHRLILKFAQRFWQLSGDIAVGPDAVFTADIVLGNYLPSDRAAVIADVAELLRAKAISKRTALRMLIEAGIPIDDAEEELKRIEAEDLEAATRLYEATGDPQILADRGIDVTPVPGPDEVPPITLPEIPAG